MRHEVWSWIGSVAIIAGAGVSASHANRAEAKDAQGEWVWPHVCSQTAAPDSGRAIVDLFRVAEHCDVVRKSSSTQRCSDDV